jgi:hypothetical protein
MLLGGVGGAGVGKVKIGKTIAYLVGPTSKTRIKEAAPIFYLRLLEGKAIESAAGYPSKKRPEGNRRGPGPKPNSRLGHWGIRLIEVGPALI